MPMNLNSTLLGAAWLQASTDFQQRVPDPSQHNMAEVFAAFEQPNCNNLFQEVTGLLTTVGRTTINSRRFQDPLAFLEGAYMPYGAVIRRIGSRWESANAYSSDSQTLLKRRKDRFIESFGGLTRMDRYDTSISRTEYMQSLQPGIGGDDGTGLDSLLGAKFDSVYSPEAYDSMRYTLQTVAEADDKWSGLYRMNVPDITSTGTGEEFMETVAGLIYRWQFPNPIYNKMQWEGSFANIGDIVVMVEPETLSKIDFRTLTNVFQNTRPEDLRRRIITVPDFPISNVRAIVADRRFFDIHRSFYSLENFYNPEQVVQNYFLHSQGAWNADPMFNIALLGDFDNTVIPVASVEPSALTLTPFSETVMQGGTVQIRAKLDGVVTATPETADTGCIGVEPDSTTWTISAPSGVALNRKTFIDRFGVLHVQKTIAPDTVLTINAKSTYINPSGETQEFTASTTITVVAFERPDNDNTEENQLGYTDIRDAELQDSAIQEAEEETPEP